MSSFDLTLIIFVELIIAFPHFFCEFSEPFLVCQCPYLFGVYVLNHGLDTKSELVITSLNKRVVVANQNLFTLTKQTDFFPVLLLQISGQILLHASQFTETPL
jgi:hypothetical protein